MKIRVTVHARTDRIVEVPDDWLAKFPAEEREMILMDLANRAADEMIDVGWEEVEE